MSYKNRKKNILKIIFSKKYLPIHCLFILITLFLILETTNILNFFGKNTSTDTTVGPRDNYDQIESVDYGPPRAEDSVISPEKNTTPKPDEPVSNASSEISVLVTRASRNSVGVFIEKIDSGACELSVTQSGIIKISMTADILQERDYSTCQGFDLDPTKLDDGPFTVKVIVNSAGRIGSATQEVE